MIRTPVVAVAAPAAVVAAELIQLKKEMTKVRLYNIFNNFQK